MLVHRRQVLVCHIFKYISTQRREITMIKVTVLSLATFLIGAIVSVSWKSDTTPVAGSVGGCTASCCADKTCCSAGDCGEQSQSGSLAVSETSKTASQACSSGCCSGAKEIASAAAKSSCNCEVCECETCCSKCDCDACDCSDCSCGTCDCCGACTCCGLAK